MSFPSSCAARSSIFSIYKELEHKLVDVDGWRPREAAVAEIEAGNSAGASTRGRAAREKRPPQLG